MQSLKQFEKLAAVPFGISSNTVDQHAQFAQNHDLTLSLLADPGLEMISQYVGSKRFGNFSMAASRQSFLIDPQGVLRKVYNPVNIFTHVDEVLSDLQTLTEVIDQIGSLQRRQREMQDSITAARRIQQSLLPDLTKFNKDAGQISILFEPMERIGGDCYWVQSNETHTWLGLFDCTGHGVPGAFITMVLLSGLQRLGVKSSHMSPAYLLDQLDQYLREIFEAEKDKFASSGAEGVLVCLDHQQNMLKVASARRPIWVQHQGGVIEEIRPQRRILGQSSKLQQWDEHTLILGAGSRLYLFSDGIPDEGNEEGFSFGKHRLKAILQHLEQFPLDVLINEIGSALQSWKGRAHQRDDQTLIAWEVPKN